jgi:hypothetical protein
MPTFGEALMEALVPHLEWLPQELPQVLGPGGWRLWVIGRH